MPDPRSCLLNFSTFGTNLGGTSPSFRLRDARRDFDNVKQRLSNIGDRIEGGINAAKQGDLLGGQFTSALNEFRCPPTPYASFFSQLQPPKYPFMFGAQININDQYKTIFGGERFINGQPSWFIKKSTRANINYEYEEVNMYNFRTKILKRSEFQPVTMTMYDDMKDATGSFWNTYIRLMSPITNIGEDSLDGYETSGMDWVAPTFINDTLNVDLRSGLEQFATPAGQEYSAGTGVLPTLDTVQREAGTNIINNIMLTHIIDFGKKVVFYQFRNPKITEIQFSELDWETSGPSTVDVTFSYDAFEISYKGNFDEEAVDGMAMPPAYPITPDGPIINAGPFSF